MSPERKVLVEYLYLDLNTCDRCIGTDAVLDEVMAKLTPALELAGYDVEYNKVEMASEEMARRYRFLSSPTIRVNERDVIDTIVETSCGCCGDISGTDVDCRAYEYAGQIYEVPPKEMLAEAILKAIFAGGAGCSCGDYELPENLKEFFEGKAAKADGCSCSKSCC